MKGSKIEILFVDDYQIILDIARSFLEDDYTVTTCINGEDAVQKVAEHDFSIIFMDLNLPGMDGFKATQQIRLMPQKRNIPIIGLSGYNSEEQTTKCFNAGMNDILKKPFNSNSISHILDKWLNGNIRDEIKTEINTKYYTSPDAPAIITSAPINYGKAIHEFENDEQLLQSIIVKFSGVVRKQFSEFKTAVKEKNIKVIKDNAHSIRGGAANLCVENLSKIAEKIELNCTDNDIESIVKDLNELEKEFHLFETYVKDTLKIALPT